MAGEAHEVVEPLTAETPEVSPCLARPGFVHIHSLCYCFIGGPAPEFTNSSTEK